MWKKIPDCQKSERREAIRDNTDGYMVNITFTHHKV